MLKDHFKNKKIKQNSARNLKDKNIYVKVNISDCKILKRQGTQMSCKYYQIL